MPSLTTLAPFCAMVLPMWTMLSPWSKNNHMAACKATNHTGTLRNLLNPASGTYTNTRWNSSDPPEPSEPCLWNLHQHAPELSGTLRNFPRPSGINLSEPSETYLRNLRQHTLEPSEIFRNLPGICFRNLHHFTPELSGTFRNLPPEPTPFYSGTLRNLPEPASGTYTSTHRNSPEPSGTRLRNPHQHTPELSGTFRNLPPEPAPATRTGTHRSLSGLKTPLAYAVGEKNRQKPSVFDVFWRFSLILPVSKKRPYEAKRIASTIFRTVSGPPKTQKTTSF